MMPLRLFILFALTITLAGCSIINKPNRDAIAGDASMDAPVDGDAGTDADADADADTDAGDACASQNEVCDDFIDNDCNGFVDCADPYCASRMLCCQGGLPDAPPWTGDELGTYWNGLPAGSETLTPNYDDTLNRLTGFDDVQGIITKQCVPLATGYRLQTNFRMESTECTGAPECYVSLVFTPAPTVRAGLRLPDDLAVTAHSDGRLTVTNGGRVLGEEMLAMVGRTTFIVDITVGSDGDTPSLLATVRLQSQEPFVDAEPIAPLDSLLTDGECVNVGGLNLAIEGSGQQFSVAPLSRGPVECINASSFLEPDATSRDVLAAEPGNLHWGSWATGGIGSPGIAYRPPKWYVVGDATDHDRALDGASAEVGFALGFANATESGWNSDWTDASTTTPKTGSCFPSCLGMPPVGCSDACDLDNSVRDPSFEQLSVELGGGALATVAYSTREAVDSYSIVVEDRFTINTGGDVLRTGSILTPDDAELDDDCLSLRDPMLVRRDRNDTMAGYWLFFSCYDGIDTADIHAIQLDKDFFVVADTHQTVVRRTTEDWAASSVWSPEVIVEHEPEILADMSMGQGRDLYRLWFMARNRDNDVVSIGLVQAQLDPDQPEGTLPEFVPFGANPILSEGDAALRCDSSECRLRGFSVVREGLTPTLRFLIAREDEGNPVATWHYVPFEQSWKSPWY